MSSFLWRHRDESSVYMFLFTLSLFTQKKQLCRKRGGARKHRVSAATHTSLELKGKKLREAKEFHKCVRMLIYCLLLYVFQLTDMRAFVVYRFLRSSCEMIVPMEFADIEVCLPCLFSDLAA